LSGKEKRGKGRRSDWNRRCRGEETQRWIPSFLSISTVKKGKGGGRRKRRGVEDRLLLIWTGWKGGGEGEKGKVYRHASSSFYY